MRRRQPIWALAIALCAGCQGVVGPTSGPPPGSPGDPNQPPPPPPPPPVVDPCAMRAVAALPLRRLSSAQYQNHLEDLLGAASPLLPGSLFPPTVITRGFSNDADANTVNTAQSNAIEDNGERIATAILVDPDPHLRRMMPTCSLGMPIADAEVDACVDGFITSFGLRAYRRPLTSNEVGVARGLYDLVRADQGSIKAWVTLVQFFVESPALLYRVERGKGPAAGLPRLVQLTSYEMASRLSFLFHDSGPDQGLLDAAAADQLETKAQIEAQARRLIQSPRFQRVMVGFHRDWLHLYEAARGKDPNVFPDYSAAVQGSLAREPDELIRVVLEGEGSLRSLLGATELPVDPTLAAYYGASAPAATASAWQTVAVPHRRGLLTLGSVQAALGKFAQSSPIHRGNFLRTSILCAPQLTLPANVDTSTPLEATAGAATARQRLAPLTTRSDCAGCHTQINPIGFAFENFDGAGKWRDLENGEAIDAAGMLDVGAGPVAYSTPSELAGLLADSDRVQRCYALQWFRASLGRSETSDDACSVATLQGLVADHQGDLRELMVALTQTDAFLYRAQESP